MVKKRGVHTTNRPGRAGLREDLAMDRKGLHFHAVFTVFFVSFFLTQKAGYTIILL